MESEASVVSLNHSAQPSHNQNQSSQPSTASAVPLSQPKDDARVEFIRRLVLRTFPALQVDALHKIFAADHVAPLLFDFIHLPDARLLLFTDHGITSSGSLKVYATPPPLLFGDSPILKTPMTVLYMTKTVKGPVQVDKPHEDILTGTLERNALESLALYLQEILIPLLGNPRNQKRWPEMVTNSVLTNVHGFFSSLQIIVGQTRGATCLPLPWDHVLMENQTNQNSSGSSSRNRDNMPYTTSPATSAPLMKDQVHGLEGCLITWTKQIKTILKQDPESAALRKTHPTVHPGPLEELLFWAAKARNLNSIFAQLQSDGVRTVLQFLDSSKSTYNVPFAKLCKEVFLARAEANDNLHFLRPMATWLEQLVAEQDFLKTRDLFRPICHSILLIWKCSRFYNTPPRLVVLVRQVCNEIIRKATQYLNGRALFELIDADDLGKANAMLLHLLQVCAHFKSVYFDYKAKSVTEVPGNPWRIQNNALFVRLDAFLERCHDVLELTQTIDQFQKLAAMEIGGTKGKTLTASVHQIYADFQDTLSTMKSVSYDLMDLDAKHFDDDFYTFRSKNKELERRLASVINQAFDDAKTIAGRFKCLDCFEDLLDRQIIKNELERKYTALIASYASDLHTVQQIFVENRDAPPIAPNLPPFAGAVTWCRGLAERIHHPMEKLQKISPRLVLEREDSKDAIKLYTNVLAMLQEYEMQMVKQWGVSIETSSKAKLKLPLLRRVDAVPIMQGVQSTTSLTTEAVFVPGGHPQQQSALMYVNFDPALVQLLREVKYFLLLRLDIPEDALAIYKKAEVFRRQTGNLELIVDMYNTIYATLLPVERPLVKTHLDRMDQALAKGVKSLNWKSHGIDVFLKESLTDVNEANTLLTQLKAHQARVVELLDDWMAPPFLFERKAKSLGVIEFEELQKLLCQQKYHVIKEGGNEIHRLLKDSLKTLRVSQGSPDWRAYVDYVSAMVEDGLLNVILQSLTHLRDQLDPTRIERDDLSALLEVELDLYGKEIVYFPGIPANATKSGLRDVLMKRIEAILHCATVFKRLDSSEGSYLKEMRENIHVLQTIADISRFLDQNEAATAAFRAELTKYEYLWTTDLPQMLMEFLATAWSMPPVLETTNNGSDAPTPTFQYADHYPTVQSATANATKAASASARNTSSAIVVSTTSSLLPPMPAQLLELSKFEDKIRFFLALQNEIAESKHATDVGFVRVNSLPIKQALSTWVTKWIYMFTQYLHDRVVNQLVWLDRFMARVHAGLDQEMEEDGHMDHKPDGALMACMHHIRDVRRLMREDVLANFAPLKEIVAVLKQNGIALEMSYVGKETVLIFLDQAPLRWENMVNKTFKKKEMIQPFQSQMVESIRAEIGEFYRLLQVLKAEFHTTAPFSSAASLSDAYEQLDAYDAKLQGFEKEAARLAELEDMFELAPSKNDILASLRKDLTLLKHVWDFVSLQDAVHGEWQRMRWHTLDSDVLLAQADDLERLRAKQLPSHRVSDWPIYQLLAEKLQQMIVVVPLVKNLKSPAMRERHWKHLMVLTRKHFDLTTSERSATSSGSTHQASSSQLRFEEVLRLELHRFVNDVNELVEVASREFKIEQQLGAIEAAWSAFLLEFVPYTSSAAALRNHGITSSTAKPNRSRENDDKDEDGDGPASPIEGSGGDLHILKPPNAIIECLEDHQLQLQTMASMGKFVAYFKDKVFEWQLRLGNVDVVLKLWITLQRQWCSLESIFMSTAGDIQSQLPQEFKRFQHVDEEIRELLHDAVLFPQVLVACCQRDGREHVLKELHAELEICQKALNQYLDAKKDVFARFYFVSNASLLEILSNGNAPPKLQPHIGNCFDGIQSFEFELVVTESSNQRRSSTSSSLTSAESRYLVLAMMSKEGEVVRFPDSHLIHGAVENWFNDLVRVMQATLRGALAIALEASALWGLDQARHAWVFDYPAQVALLASQIVWTEEVEAALEEVENGSEDALKKYVDVSTVRLEEFIKLVQSSSLTPPDRAKIITLITIDVHARDVVQSLIAKKVNSALEFPWQSQLRCYAPGSNSSNSGFGGVMDGARKKTEVVIKICDFRTFYSYEYTGNCGRLVITPLTDRCYVTLTTALRLCLGGAPAGPAGTGKTETTKDLARGMGLPCYVFNCSDQMNYKTMADVFKGLAQTGAWGCFDEFNRISVEVLSVVATQVKTVLDALLPLAATMHRVVSACSGGGSSDANATDSGGGNASSAMAAAAAAQAQLLASNASLPLMGSCDFFGKTIALSPTVGLFITMNPGYAGRAELPENLKALFRSCAMIKPDLQPICENMLMAEGFLKARVLSVKFVTLYDLSCEMLSKQTHYDWGLRAVKSVLLVAGSLLRRAGGTQASEDNVLMQVLRDFNTPRLLPADYPVFLGLLNDLFPGQTLPRMANDSLRDACVAVCASQKLQPEDCFVKKVLELEDVLRVRHSVMLIGPAGCGKSTIWSTLASCHNHGLAKASTVFESVNPKSLTADELYGFMTLDNDWKDGVLSSIMRNMSKGMAPFSDAQQYKWIVLDGDIDAVWIESMNTVMDDNKMLTLVSNERIPLTKSMRMMFEVHSLQNATPATVSRAGIIYVSEGDIGWLPFAESWVARRHGKEDEKAVLASLFRKYIDSLFAMMKEHKLAPIVPLPAIAVVSTLCRLLDGMLAQLSEQDKSPDAVENVFIYCAIWAFGGALDNERSSSGAFGGGGSGGGSSGGGGALDQRKAFSTHFKSLAKFKYPEPSATSSGGAGAQSGGGGGLTVSPISLHNLSVFDICLDMAASEFVPWRDRVPPFASSLDAPFHQLIVPTVESTRLHALLELLMARSCPVLLVGAAGTGKTALIRDHLKNLDSDDVRHTHVVLHHFMDAKQLQLRLEKYLEKRSGRVFGPLQNRKLVYFLDDFNMPFVESYGSQTPMALLRQWMEYGAWYDRHDLTLKKTIQDVQLVASMNHKTGSFTIHSRLQRHFATFAVPMAGKSVLTTMYATLLSQHLQGFSDPLQKMGSSLVAATIDLYADVRTNFLPTATKFHYQFSMRDLGALFQGLSLARPHVYRTSTLMLARLWLHECYRVFSDRMATASEVQRFTDMALEQAKKHLDDDPSEVFAIPLVCASFIGRPGGGSDASVASALPSSPLRPSSDDDSASGTSLIAYVPVADKLQLTVAIEQHLRAYNELHPVLNLVLFDHALEHIARIARMLLHPRSHGLLIGVGGSGKQSLAKLAAFICGCSLHGLSLSATPRYGVTELKEDLKDIYRKAAVRPATPLVLMLTDAHLNVDETFLIYINDMMTTCEIPDLFSPEEMDAMISSLRVDAKARGIPDTKEHLQTFFYDRVRANLHVLLACSPVGDELRMRCRRFPVLVSGTCTMDWFYPWPRDALVDVAMQFLQDVELSTSAIQDNVCHHMAEMHLSVTHASTSYARQYGRYNYVTPTSFLELIKFYKSLLSDKRHAQRLKIQRLDVGLATLKKTSRDVAQLQLELKKTLKKVDERKQATDALLEQMGKQRGDAEIKQKRADDERAKAAAAAATAANIEAQSSVELAQAKPALDAAQQAVNCLNKASLTELKSMGKPPPGVDKVTAAVLMLLKNEKSNFTWDNAKKMMAKVDVFKQALEQFDKENIPADIVARVEPILEDPNFNFEKMKTKSVAAANLCVWVVNIVAYHHVYVKVKPLMDTLEHARKTKADADAELETVQKLVAEVEAQLNALQLSFRDATNEKAKVEAEAAACQERLSLAERLVNGLASEKDRWSREIDVLKAGETALIGDTLLAAGFVSYVGAFNASFRSQLWRHSWLPDIVTREIPITLGGAGGAHAAVEGERSNVSGGLRRQGSSRSGGGLDGIVGDIDGASSDTSGANAWSSIDPVNMLSDGSAIALWMNEGLPADRISIENGCIITSCERWPLLVDPQLQGLTWLRARDFEPLQEMSESPTAPPQEKNTRQPQPSQPFSVSKAQQDDANKLQATSNVPKKSELGRKRNDPVDASIVGKPVLSESGTTDKAETTGKVENVLDTSLAAAPFSPLIILHTSQKAWIKTLKTAISAGQNVILENVGETLDATLEPVVMRQIYRKGRHWFVYFAAEEIAFDPRFRLYLHTKLPNPHFRPEVLAYCTLIDFSVTEKGLEDQVLARVVNLEQPTLETHKQRLQQAFNGYQIQLRQLENQLLERLSNAPEDILSDVPLIEGLEKTKQTANEVALALLQGKEAEQDINLAREVYRPVASEASMLYFLMNQLCKVNHMYRYSLESFMTFFYVAMAKIPRLDADGGGRSMDANASGAAEGGFLSSSTYAAALARVPLLREALRWTLYEMVSRGLLEEHKLLFLTQMVLLLLRRGVIGTGSGYADEPARFLLHGPKAIGPENTISWLSETQWQSLQALITLEPFERFVADLEESEARFKEWYNTASPETERLPLDWRDLDKTAPFLKLLVVRCLRPDRLSHAISAFVSVTLPHGPQYLACDAKLNSYAILESAFQESTPSTPLFFVLSPGTDVVADLDKLAVQAFERIKGVDYHNIALGQGQETVAMQKLELSTENGHWILLNNVHLMPKWMLELDAWLEQLAKASKTASYASLVANISSGSGDGGTRPCGRSSLVANAGSLHPMFRLFITSDPSTSIPIGVLERSIKLTNEPPSGLKANVKRAWSCFAPHAVDELEPRTRIILFAMCYFHALVLERKKFGPQGFNLVYPFAASDLLASSTVLRNYMEGNAPARVPWADLRYLFGEIMYGGHIVNERDRLVATTYLHYFLRDELLDELSMVPYAEETRGKSTGGDDGPDSGGGGGGGDGGDGAGASGGGGRRLDFMAPKLTAGYERMLDHVETALTNDSPTAFGLHPNAEVAFRTAHGDRLMHTILLLTKKDDEATQGARSGTSDEEDAGGADDGSASADAVQIVAEGVLQDILENYRDFRFDIHELFFKSVDVGGSASRALVTATALEEMDPFQNVLLQECERLNALLECMTKSLVELEMGFRGEVTLTASMETLQACLYCEQIPIEWELAAYPSRRSLAPWLANLQQRITQLQEWTQQAPELPTVVWFPGLFNPQSFLTAVLQTSARKNGLELDKLSIMTDVTKRTLEAIDAPSRDGQYIYGLALEGARWDVGNGLLEVSQPKEMYVTMPVLNVRAVLAARKETSSSVYECPVYRTQQRGATLVFSAQLRTKHPSAKWVLAGVALLMETV